jgi:hypothetical protein
MIRKIRSNIAIPMEDAKMTNVKQVSEEVFAKLLSQEN